MYEYIGILLGARPILNIIRIKVKERIELHLYSPSGTSWPVLGRIVPLPLPIISMEMLT
jgi:hypothetical protein